ncbi:YggT family protein [Ramlibacter sp. H39-3-26]|nr:YggT family protein [Ramlibacter sp. H39-3-26]
MFIYQTASLLLDVVAGLLGGACLLRLYMQLQRVPFANPLGRFVIAVSNWLVLPLRRVFRAVGRFDVASALGGWLIVLAKTLLLWLLAGALDVSLAALAIVSVFGVLKLAVSGLMGLIIVHAVLSWVPNAASPMQYLLALLVEPVVRPVRRVVPAIGGIDLSPLVAIVALQILNIALAAIEARLLGL